MNGSDGGQIMDAGGLVAAGWLATELIPVWWMVVGSWQVVEWLSCWLIAGSCQLCC